jgi:DNA-binding Lrp family transcriptional regulator
MYAAYVLIDLSTDVDFPETLEMIRGIAGVKQAHLAVGPNDCIAYIEVADQRKAIETLQAIRNIEGVVKTDTRPVAEM